MYLFGVRMFLSNFFFQNFIVVVCFMNSFFFETPNPMDTGRKLNIRKTFRRRVNYVLCKFNLRPVFMEN